MEAVHHSFVPPGDGGLPVVRQVGIGFKRRLVQLHLDFLTVVQGVAVQRSIRAGEPGEEVLEASVLLNNDHDVLDVLASLMPLNGI